MSVSKGPPHTRDTPRGVWSAAWKTVLMLHDLLECFLLSTLGVSLGVSLIQELSRFPRKEEECTGELKEGGWWEDGGAGYQPDTGW